MRLNRFRTGQRAVSPVIGVLLMVAITVVLASVTGVFVLGTGVVNVEPVPQTQFTVEYDETAGTLSDGDCRTGGSIDAGNGELTITHQGGETIPVDNLTIRGASSSPDGFADCSSLSSGDNVGTQDSAYVEAAEDDVVRLVWESDEEDNSHTLATWNGTAET